MFVFWPLVELFIISMQSTDFITTSFVGLKNYVRIMQDPVFIRSALNSFAYIFFNVLFTVGGAVTISLLAMDLSKKWQDITRILVYIPILSAGIIIAQIWKWIFHVNGPINWLLGADIHWFGQGITAIPAISLIVSMSGVGGTTIVILAAILSINSELYDAAQIDGASWLTIKTRIVLPLIAPTIGVMMLIAAIAAPQIFENIYALAPFEYSATMGWRIYVEAFQMGSHGTAAAISVVLLFMLLGLSWLKTRLQHDE